jgi:hypothetical protein
MGTFFLPGGVGFLLFGFSSQLLGIRLLMMNGGHKPQGGV